MKFIKILINFIICYIATSAAAAMAGYYSDPEYPGKCVIRSEGLIMSIGESKQEPGLCGMTKCGPDSLFERYSCGVIFVPKGCKLKENLDPYAYYPKCCPTGYICNDVLEEDNKENK